MPTSASWAASGGFSGLEGIPRPSGRQESLQALCAYDLSGELALVADPAWDPQPDSGDVPWEVTGDAYGDSFDASF
jgi:hypothetical protein